MGSSGGGGVARCGTGKGCDVEDQRTEMHGAGKKEGGGRSADGWVRVAAAERARGTASGEWGAGVHVQANEADWWAW